MPKITSSVLSSKQLKPLTKIEAYLPSAQSKIESQEDAPQVSLEEYNRVAEQMKIELHLFQLAMRKQEELRALSVYDN